MPYKKPHILSSYSINNLGLTLYETVLIRNPKIIIEFGTLHGYSAICMAQALQHLGSNGHIICYDLWNKYPYKHTTLDKTFNIIKSYGLEKYITLKELDFYNWDYEPFDMMHFDISNHGGKIRSLHNKVRIHQSEGLVLFEGGSKLRDEVPWMKDYEPINNCGINYHVLNEAFPSISIML